MALPLLTRDQVAKAWAAYLRTGNKSEAARVVGCDEATIRRMVQKKLKDAPELAEMHTQALLEGEVEVRDLMALVRDRLRTILQNPNATVDEIRQAAAAVHEGGKVASHIRVNQAKVMGKLIERGEIKVQATTQALTIIAPPEVEPE